jgi:hypothetical protein
MSFTAGTLRLILGSYDLTIASFTDLQYPRILPRFVETTESQSGTVVLSGSAYELKHRWQVECSLDETDLNTLDAMHQYGYKNNLELVIHDYTQEVTEIAQTRNTAISATVSNDGTQSRYYARFRALFDSDITKTKRGDRVICAFGMRETSIIPN